MQKSNYQNSIASHCLQRAKLRRALFALALTMFVFALAHAQTPPTASPTVAPSSVSQSGVSVTPLSLDEAVRLSLRQASTFQQAALNERVAAEDVRQSRTAFRPRVESAPSVIYTSPARGLPAGQPRTQSFIANNAITEYQALVNVTGELDISGRLRATLRRNVALLEAARAGTAVAQRALIAGVNDAYYGLALASAKRGAAEQNLAAAEEFERVTSLLLSGGEVAPLDLTRARLQTIARRDELEQARANEIVAADALRVLVGYDFATPIATTDLLMTMPDGGDIDRFTAEAIQKRPEIAQFEAERRAAEQDIKLARAERRPQVTYTLSGGVDTDSLRSARLREHSGYSATIGVSIPIFDWGANRSRVRQAQLRAQAAEQSRAVAMRGFAQQFYDARALAVSALARIRLAGTGVMEAESNLRASIARYRAGEAQVIEVTDAQNTLITERTAFYQAIFDYQTARARLMQATGQ
jgi:outer membrane protein